MFPGMSTGGDVVIADDEKLDLLNKLEVFNWLEFGLVNNQQNEGILKYLGILVNFSENSPG